MLHEVKRRLPRLLFFDSGLGGLTVLNAARHAIPEAEFFYVADDAGFPYGAKGEAELRERILAVMGEAIARFEPDCAVIACNTASTLSLPALREAFPLPFVGTVPAIKPAANLTASGLVSVLATPATISRDYTKALIDEFGGGADFNLVGAAKLAAFAEAHSRGERVADADIAREIAPAFLERGGKRTDVVVLACTHYPLLLDRFEAVAPWPVNWLDPAPAIARRVANVLAERNHVVGVGSRLGSGSFCFTSGASIPTSLEAVLKTYGLALATGLKLTPA